MLTAVKLVEDDGIEPSLSAYQTGVLPLDESSFLLEKTGGLLLEGGAITRALVGMARVELAASSL
jgi:hypothetical protein